MTIKFKLRRPQEKQTSIFVEFKKNAQKIVLFPGKIVQTEHWHIANQVCKKSHPAASEMNLFLRTWKDDLEKIILSLETKKEFICKSKIQEELNRIYKLEITKENEITDFIDFMQWYISTKKDKKPNLQRLNQNKKNVILGFKLISKQNLAQWNKLGTKQKSKSDLKADYKLDFKDINLSFIQKFREYMYNTKFKIKIKGVMIEQNYKINYIDKQVNTLKQFIMAAIEAGYVDRFTWNGIKSEKKDVDSIYTDFVEIQSLFDEPFSRTEKLVRDKYVLNCFLGMRYSDLNKLKSHFFQKRVIGGKSFVVYSGRSQKTDHKIEFALHPMAQIILESYNYDMPKLSSKEFNEKLKVVAHKAGLKGLERIREIRGTQTIIKDVPKYELMSSHAGRRSFCTNFYNEGVSIAAIMSISGHKTEIEFRKYIKKASVRLDVVAEQVFAIKGINTTLKVT